MQPDPPGWVADTVFYQVFPDRFASSSRVAKPGALEPWAAPTDTGYKGGDLLGLAERLDDLVDLGIDGLYLNPIFTATSNHRYNAYDYRSVDPLLGGDAAFAELLEAAHARGIRVILDGVFNHSGAGSGPSITCWKRGASPYRDWFYLDETCSRASRRACLRVPRGARPASAATGRGGASRRCPSSGSSIRPSGSSCSVAEHWLRFGIDGWRLDVPQTSRTRRSGRRSAERVRAVEPEAYLVGEIWEEAPEWLPAIGSTR